MSDLIGATAWANYQALIGGDAFDTFFQQDIIWKRSGDFLDIHGEDEIGKPFTDVTLKCLADYNDFRTWPITRHNETGELDKQTVVILLSIKYLENLGYMNANGNFDYKGDEDRFELDGILYKPNGDTNVAQAQDIPLMVQLVLERETVQTSDDGN